MKEKKIARLDPDLVKNRGLREFENSWTFSCKELTSRSPHTHTHTYTHSIHSNKAGSLIVDKACLSVAEAIHASRPT